jgi:hypothetical protein
LRGEGCLLVPSGRAARMVSRSLASTRASLAIELILCLVTRLGLRVDSVWRVARVQDSGIKDQDPGSRDQG